MKNVLLMFISLFVFATAYAHAPRSVDITYDKEKEVLTVEMEHRVRDVSNHYIDVITVFVNDKEAKKKTLEQQSDDNKEKQTFQMDGLKAGDIVRVHASCNRVGSRSSTITIE